MYKCTKEVLIDHDGKLESHHYIIENEKGICQELDTYNLWGRMTYGNLEVENVVIIEPSEENGNFKIRVPRDLEKIVIPHDVNRI